MVERVSPGESQRLLTRRQLAREERSRRARRVLYMFAALAILLAVAIPATGYYIVFVRPLQEKVVGVNEVTYNLDYVLGRVRRTLLQAAGLGDTSPEATNESIMGALQEIQREELLRQAAPRLGITATEEEVRERLGIMLGAPFRGETAGAERADLTFQELYRQRLNVLRMSDGEYKDIIRADVLRKKLEERLEEQLPRGDEQLQVSVILVDSDKNAQEVLQRLQAGEDFARVAEEVSQHTLTNKNGGDWGWYVRGLKPEFDKIWFSLDVGDISDPVVRAEGTYIFKISDYETYRELTDSQKRLLRPSLLEEWIKEERARNAVWQAWDQSRYLYIYDKLSDDPLLQAARDQASG